MMCTQNPEQSHRQEVIKAWDDTTRRSMPEARERQGKTSSRRSKPALPFLHFVVDIGTQPTKIFKRKQRSDIWHLLRGFVYLVRVSFC